MVLYQEICHNLSNAHGAHDALFPWKFSHCLPPNSISKHIHQTYDCASLQRWVSFFLLFTQIKGFRAGCAVYGTLHSTIERVFVYSWYFKCVSIQRYASDFKKDHKICNLHNINLVGYSNCYWVEPPKHKQTFFDLFEKSFSRD